MRSAMLEILRCPFCGGRLQVVSTLPHWRDGDQITGAILGCYCCVYPVVAGIPVLHLDPAVKTAREQIEAERPDLAERTMFGLRDEAGAERFARATASPRTTYREAMEALGSDFEGGYFLYRFSDPTYLVAEAVVRAVTRVAGGRAIDLCGGSGHLTRALLDLSSSPPVVADLYFSKLWLARRFTAPGCEPVCCDANAPLPFADGAFDVAVCSDAFHYVWTKKLFASEMMRLAGPGGAVTVAHAHNERAWNPSAGMPLPPEAYRELFAPLGARLYGETALLSDVVDGGPLDLSRADSAAALDAEPALTIVASRREGIFGRHAIEGPPPGRGELCVNPLYEATREGDRVRLRLRFPSPDYEAEYGACRLYLPDEVTVEAEAIEGLAAGRVPPALRDLVRRRVVLELPAGYC